MNALVDHKAFATATSASTAVSLFDFQPAGGKVHQIRVVEIDGEPWFVATDVCSALNIAPYADGTPNVSNATRTLEKDEKFLLRRTTPQLARGSVEALFARRQPSLLAISESGLYKLILRSDKPEAKPFQDWVTKVVLPANTTPLRRLPTHQAEYPCIKGITTPLRRGSPSHPRINSI